jgi:hypothetical protein
MDKSPAEALFQPFPFTSQPVPVATTEFDFEAWKREPSGPVILKGKLADWPLFQNLRKCADDDARLDYLTSRFGSAEVAYTRVPSSDPFMGYDEDGRQNFKYAPADCTLSELCSLMRTALRDPNSDILYARGGANSVRTWKGFSEAIRPFDFLKNMKPNGEGIWLGTGRHISYLHQDAHFNFLIMITGVKRVLLYPLESIGDLYPTPFYGGIAGTTSSFVRPRTPDLRRFPRFANAAKSARVALFEEGDVLCLPPCWWHYVEAAPGLNLMINTFVWALPPRKVREFEIVMRESIKTALGLPKDELLAVRDRLYHVEGRGATRPVSESARALSQSLGRFLAPEIPGYWHGVARAFYDHYVFQVNGEPVPTYPERHTDWLKQQMSLPVRLRLWLRFNRDQLRMNWLRRKAAGIVP